MSVGKLSHLSEILFGRSSHYYIPHYFYHELRVETPRPSIYQLFALSKISNYRLYDWLRVFGFQLDDIPRMEILLQGQRTVILDSTNYEKEAWMPWFKKTALTPDMSKITPLSQLFTADGFRRIRSIELSGRKSFFYAKIGRDDILAFPKVVPGSIVRVDPDVSGILDQIRDNNPPQRLYLVEHSKGLSCCNLSYIGGNTVTLSSSHLPGTHLTFRLEREIRIWGIVDQEIRPLKHSLPSRVSRKSVKTLVTEALWKSKDAGTLRELTRRSRLRIGLSFGEASAITRRIAEYLGDKRYFTQASSLSHYETLNLLPKHIEKIFSLCIVYCIGFSNLLASAGIDPRKAGRETIPEELFPHTLPAKSRRPAPRIDEDGKFSHLLLKGFENPPLFLRGALSNITGPPSLSVRDVFWMGTQNIRLHPLLQGAYLIAVNRRVKKPQRTLSKHFWDRQLYLVLLRDGSYTCGACTLENDILGLVPFPKSSSAPQMFRNKKDAEVVGQVVAILRKL